MSVFLKTSDLAAEARVSQRTVKRWADRKPFPGQSSTKGGHHHVQLIFADPPELHAELARRRAEMDAQLAADEQKQLAAIERNVAKTFDHRLKTDPRVPIELRRCNAWARAMMGRIDILTARERAAMLEELQPVLQYKCALEKRISHLESKSRTAARR